MKHMKRNVLQRRTTQLGLILLLMIGLIFTIIVVQRQQNYRGRAELDVAKTFTVTDPEGQPVSCEGTTCTTGAESVHVEFNEENLQDLLNAL